MFVTPVTSVFSHYLSLENQLLTKHIKVMADWLDDSDNAVIANPDQCQQHAKSKLSCDTNSLCSFSICGYGNITVAFLLWALAYSAYRYRQIKKSFPRSLVIPPEIKPPISIYSL
jgi:hypothetical protein